MAKIELRHLRTLVALRDTGTLVEAADRLCLTQSALSHQVKDVEDRLQCSLFMRKTRPVRFTSAGQRLLALAYEIRPQTRGQSSSATCPRSRTASSTAIALEIEKAISCTGVAPASCRW